MLTGQARNAHAGAVLLCEDRTPVYLAGIPSWDDHGIDGETIEARGTLRLRSLAPDPVVEASGSVSHGIEGDSFVLEDARWSVIG